MPPISFWFTGSAIGACIALIVSVTSLGWAWYNAALTEQKSARSNERLTQVRQHLQNFFIRGAQLRDRPLQKDASEADFKNYVAEVEAWVNETNNWIRVNLGDAASAKFLDIAAGSWLHWNRAINEQHNAVINDMVRWTGNLTKLIESDAWDAKK